MVILVDNVWPVSLPLSKLKQISARSTGLALH
jgi:hypothetical protein